MSSPLVSISCITFNHEKYIRKCLDGFLNQKCDFEFEILINDDASTDDTQKIIKEYQEKYPKIVKPIFQTTNQYSQGVRGMMMRYNFPRAMGKYIALCEGDDYWTDPLKLQKQVDFLENRLDYNFVCGGYATENSKTVEKEILVFHGEGYLNNSEKGFDLTLETFFDNWVTKTLTIMFRKSSLDSNELSKYAHLRDVHLNFMLLKAGKGYYFKEILGVYNIHEGGIFSLIDEIQKIKSQYEIRRELFLKNKSIDSVRHGFKNVLEIIVNKRMFREKEFSRWKLALDYVQIIRNTSDLKYSIHKILFILK